MINKLNKIQNKIIKIIMNTYFKEAELEAKEVQK